MKNSITRLLGVSAPCLLALTTHLSAQTSAFTYQGALTQNGQPANGTYDFMFRLMTAPTDGSAAPVIQVNPGVGVTNGLFTTGIDFDAENLNGANLWLEISVRTNGGGAFTTLAPRQLLTSVPYAVRAANFGGTVAASQLTGTIAPNNIGAGSITSSMLANGAVGASQLAAGGVTSAALAAGSVTAAKMDTVTNWFALTIANPTPAAGDWFGVSAAAVGGDRVLIGARSADADVEASGAAYLFDISGRLLSTFTNPSPDTGDRFGQSVAAVGNDGVVIGAPGDSTHVPGGGAAYLFGTNGTWWNVFTNPSPAAHDQFGISVAGLGHDRVIVGAYSVDAGLANAGAAYLFRTDGTLLMTITNPTPIAGELFGNSVAAVGDDRILVGTFGNVGVAYLFGTNGTLVTTFSNPSMTAGDVFGFSVAAVGNDRVLIGAYGNDTGAGGAGAAYLFGLDGSLLSTYLNPTPGFGDNFGWSVAGVGDDRVLISADRDDTGVEGAGAAYLFSTDGTLLTTLFKPNPAEFDNFGSVVTAVGEERVLVGATRDDTGAQFSGAAYLFGMERFSDGLVAEAVHARGVNTASLEDGAVTLAKLDPSIGVWTRSGDHVLRQSGNVGIGTASPTTALDVNGTITATVFSGSGVGLTSLSTGSLVGTVADAQLSANVALLNRNVQVFTGTNAFGGNVGVGTNSPNERLVVAGNIYATGTITPNSDRNLKTDLKSVNAAAILEKVSQLPIQQWRFKAEPDGVKHVGPMAQDFRAAFGLGTIPTAIATVDADGVALAAIQGLNQKLEDQLEQKQTEITELQRQNAELLKRMEAIEARIR